VSTIDENARMPRDAQKDRWLTMVKCVNSQLQADYVHQWSKIIFKAFDQRSNISDHHCFALQSGIFDHIRRTMYINDCKCILGSIDVIRTPLLPSPNVSDVAS